MNFWRIKQNIFNLTIEPFERVIDLTNTNISSLSIIIDFKYAINNSINEVSINQK